MATGSRLNAAPVADPDLWRPTTILVAWELAMARIRVHPELLADVREHVLRCLPPQSSIADLDDAVPPIVQDYIGRVRKGRYVRTPLPTCAPNWHPTNEDADSLLSNLAPLEEAVVRLHFGDGMSLAKVAEQTRVGEHQLRACREGLREHLSVHLGFQGAPSEQSWASHLDARWRLLANRPLGNCPGPLGLTTDSGLRHADRCTPCGRAVRLIRGGVLQPRSLFRPHGDLVGDDQVQVLALLVHPDGRRHQATLEAALPPGAAVAAGPDAWLVREEAVPGVLQALRGLCEAGTPARHHIRGAVLGGPGRWSQGVLLGPLGVAAIEAARARPWADLGGLTDLPTPMPPPPSARGWWLGAAAAAALALGIGAATLGPEPTQPDTPVAAGFLPTATGWSVRFDTEDLATVDVVALDEGTLSIRLRSVRAAKGAWATGDGDYALEIKGDDVAVITSPEGLEPLEAWVHEAARQPDPLLWLRDHLLSVAPQADVAVSPARLASLDGGQAAYTPRPDPSP